MAQRSELLRNIGSISFMLLCAIQFQPDCRENDRSSFVRAPTVYIPVKKGGYSTKI